MDDVQTVQGLAAFDDQATCLTNVVEGASSPPSTAPTLNK